MVVAPSSVTAVDPGLRRTCHPIPEGAGGTGAIAGRALRGDAGGDEPVIENTQPETELLLNGEPYTDGQGCGRKRNAKIRWKTRVLIVVLVIETCFALPKLAQGQFLSVFDAIFSSIQNDIGCSLKTINQITQQMQKLYQTTVEPLAAINQARGFVANSINTYRGQMNQVFNTPFTSAVTPGPQQFESILHSRLSAQI